MKHKKLFYILVVFLFFSRSYSTALAQTAAPSPALPAATGHYQPTTIPPIPDAEYNKLEPEEQAEVDAVQQELDNENKKSATVYGKAVDQYGQPVSGAQAIATALFNVSMVASRSEEHFTTTDANGFFQFVGVTGERVGFGVKKAGYVWNGKRISPASGQSTPQNREVFVLYKLQGAEPMMHAKVHDYIPCDGTEIQYDLQTGKRIVSGGGLIIKFTRNPVQIHRGTPFEWTLVMTVTGNGGLIEMSDSYPYEAPADGYQKTVTITTGPNPSHYTDSASKSYYYKSSDEKYGRLTFTLQADFQPPPTLFNVDIYVNPSGSKNLEWDETKQVKP